MSSQYDTKITKPSNHTQFNIVDREHVNYLFHLIYKAHTTSLLHKLEYYREELCTSAFRMLLVLLTKDLSSDIQKKILWDMNSHACNVNSTKSMKRWLLPTKIDIDQCCRILFYYIVSVMNKYNMSNCEEIWTSILENELTKTEQFYLYLHKKKIIVPKEICEIFSQRFSEFYASQTMNTKIKLIELGFTVDGLIHMNTKIKHIEKIFSLLKQHDTLNNIHSQPDKHIIFMNTPEKLSLFLYYFPDFDINQVNAQTQLNVLDQLINMKPYIYLPNSPVTNWSPSLRNSSHSFDESTIAPLRTSSWYSHPNELVKYRATRIINLLQQLILRGAQLSKPISHDGMMSPSIAIHPFYATTIGIYVLIDLHPNELSLDLNDNFVSCILQYITRFSIEFQEFIAYRLSLSYSIIHNPMFMSKRRLNENENTQKMNDILFQRTLTLKEWCRLKIKSNSSQTDIRKLNLSQSLIDYCTFNFFQSNYGIQSVEKVVKFRGNVLPRWIRFENAALDEMQIDNDHEENDQSDVSVDDGDYNYHQYSDDS